MHRIALAALPLVLTLLPHAAGARVTALDILERTPFADGAPFGPAGAYERIRATAHGELDPASPANAVITDISRAPRNAHGMVEYDTDVFILRPVDPAAGNGVLLYEVLNRGHKFLPSWLDDAADGTDDPCTAADAGNGFAFRRGYTMAWSGWQPEVARTGGLMGLGVPVATADGQPITRRIRFEFAAGTRGPDVVRSVALPYPNLETASAASAMRTLDVDANRSGEVQIVGKTRFNATSTLTVRAREADPEQTLPQDAWSFVGNTVQLQSGPLEPRKLYELTYHATAPTLDGIGFAATRDVVAYLRQGDAAGPVRHAIGFGISLSGRFLRNFIELGMNRGEDGARVFDGVLAHISGAGKVFANFEFAMPGRTATQHEDRTYPENWFPFAGFPATDPMTGQTGALLRGDGSDPLVLESNTSTEYWQKGASLIHTDPATGADRPLPPTMRAYLLAGGEHIGHAGASGAPGPCANPRNPMSAGPLLRALVVALTEWVVDGTPPPDSRVPLRADGTGVPAASVRRPALPGVTWAPRDNPVGPPVDWTAPPAVPARTYPTMVSAVDADGNERAGVRLPDVAVPLGTRTGANVYADYPSELCDRDGSFIPFARTAAERAASGDPRPALAERYASRDAYAAQVRAAADTLVAGRLMLAEDRDAVVRTAEGGERF